MENTRSEWQSPEDLAEELDIPVATVYQWRYKGTGPVAHKIGRHLRYRRADVEAWLASTAQQRTS